MANTNDKIDALQVKEWAAEVLHQEGIVDVKINGTTEKGDGYMGDILFLTISTQQNGASKVYDMVLKIGKVGCLRDFLPVQEAFEREIYFYTEVVPVFTDFVKSKTGISSEIDIYPKCYGTILRKDRELVFLKNLKTMGYDLHDRRYPMDMNHIKLTVTNYGRHHAFSLAMKDQKPKEFNDLCQKNLNHQNWKSFTAGGKGKTFKEAVEESGEFIHEAIKESEDKNLLKLFETWCEKKGGYFANYVHYLDLKFDDSILTHGDCWNNNFMFTYKDGLPLNCCFLDFQFCSLTSPMFDLCYHLSCVCPNEILTNLEDFSTILNIYYNSLAENIRILGSDPAQCFSREKFLEHWKIISGLGIVFAGIILPTTTQNKEDMRSWDNMEEITDHHIVLTEEQRKILYERFRAIVKNVLVITPKI